LESAKLASSAKCEVLFLLIEALFGTSFIEAEDQVVTRYFFQLKPPSYEKISCAMFPQTCVYFRSSRTTFLLH
jgi:hypothetical protein